MAEGGHAVTALSVRPPPPRLRRTLSLGERKWRRGELNPCPRRYPRKHLHVYPAINSEEPSHAPAHCRLPSVREIDSQIGAVAPPICQPAVHVCRRSRRPASNVAVNQAARARPSLSAFIFLVRFLTRPTNP